MGAQVAGVAEIHEPDPVAHHQDIGRVGVGVIVAIDKDLFQTRFDPDLGQRREIVACLSQALHVAKENSLQILQGNHPLAGQVPIHF